MPGESGTPATERAKRARLIAWVPILFIALWVLVDVALLRYAIDLLPVFCAMVLLAHSVRDALGDWFAGDPHEGEPDPVWALGVIGINLFAAVFGLLWIFSTSPWVAGTRFAAWIPTPVASMASLAEAHGWGRRAVLSGGPSVAVQAGSNSATADTLGRATPRKSPHDRTASLGSAPAEQGPGEVAGTAGQAITRADTSQQDVGPHPTSIALASSASVLRVGSQFQLTATVAASGRRPTGSVVFQRDGQVMGSARVDDQGRAVLNVASLPPGTHTIRAEFAPGADLARSRSRSLILFVRP